MNGVRKGLRLDFVDNGPGIANVELALRDGYTTSTGLGLGLSGVAPTHERVRDRVEGRRWYARECDPMDMSDANDVPDCRPLERR